MKAKILFLLIFFSFSLTNLFAQGQVTGTITDDDGMAIPGITVVVKGTTTGTITDFDGSFTIKAKPSDVLVASYVGYVTREVPVGNSKNLTIVLQQDIATLDEVIVIGYGTSTKKTLVSAVASISAETIQDQPVSRIDQTLQGRAAGVEVTSNNGAPGAGTTIRIRGASSINGNNNPLFVIDGFIVGTGFDLNTLNTNDVESVQILKDATALSIYGTRGAAGVILITTKSGKGIPTGKPVISVNQFTTIQELANKIELVGGVDYANYVNEARQFIPGPDVIVNGVSLPVGLTDPTIDLFYPNPSEVPNTDWIDEVSQMGSVSNTDLSITGNTDNANYYVSMNYFNQRGILKSSGLERAILRANLDINASDRFTTGIRLNLSNYKRENNKVNFSEIVTSVLPARAIFDEDGNFTDSHPISGGLQSNPVADAALRVRHDLVTNLITNTYFEYELFKDFKLKSTVGATLNFIKRNRYSPGILPQRLAAQDGGFGSVETVARKDILNENTFTYYKNFGDHSLKVLGGFTWQKITSEQVFASAEGFPNDVLEFNRLQSGSEPETYQVRSDYNQRTLVSFLGRINYTFKDKYLLTLVGREDGSSVFEEGKKYAFFPSIGMGWNIDEENFLSNSDIIDRLKLRGSFGIVGEQGVAAYNSLDLFSPTFTFFNENLVPAVVLRTPGTDGLEWETTEQLDLGLELGLFNNRISLEVDYYKKTTKDLLLNRDLPDTAGGRLLENVGSVENKGFEFSLNTININTNTFKWETSLVLSTNKSKVLDLGDEEFINLQNTGNQGGTSARLIVGQPMPVFVGAEYLGTYKDPQEIIDDGLEGRAFLGSPRFRDVDGDGAINNNDAVIIGSPQPDFYGGIHNTFSYQGISLDIFFQGSYGGDIFNTLSQQSFYGRDTSNLDPRVLDRWIAGVNETSNVPRAGTSLSTFNPNSTVNIEDGSFLRLRTVTLGYDVPVKKMRGLSTVFDAVNVYVAGNNLLLFSDFRLGDPEVNTFTDGSGFRSVSQGFAAGQYPYATSITAGFKMKF